MSEQDPSEGEAQNPLPELTNDILEDSFEGYIQEQDEDSQGENEQEEEKKDEAESALDAEEVKNEDDSEKHCEVTESSTTATIENNVKEVDPLYFPGDFETLPEYFNEDEFPESYKRNTLSEERLLEYCNNFRRQYATLFPDRTRLLLNPLNECGLEKFVCTTLHPVHLPFPELYTWEGAAKFVADFLQFIPLLPSTEIPKRLLSPSTTVSIQKGTCFEYASLLCSLLIGVGYDAYVVSGYATRECCYMDESRLVSPFKPKPPEPVSSEEDSDFRKYVIRPPKDLTSQYDHLMVARELQEEEDRIEQDRVKAAEEEEEAFLPQNDPLYGLRVHAWILILAGKRDVEQSFFIETLTGKRHPLDCSLYLGIESVWNAENYWVNMQDCSTGIAHLEYDLKDGNKWEFVLPSGSISHKINFDAPEIAMNQGGFENSDQMTNDVHVHSTLNFDLINNEPHRLSLIDRSLIGPSPTQNLSTFQSGDAPRESMQLAGKRAAALQDKLLLLDLPPSWTSPIHITRQRYELRYPNGVKTMLYRRCKVDYYAPYSQPDGIVFRLTNYKDRNCTDPIDILEKYAHRADKLLTRFTQVESKQVTETFDHGRAVTHLAEHCYFQHQPGFQTNRTMRFYNNARVDGLQMREQTPNTMKEYYIGREDRMCYREVLFGAKVKKYGAPQMSKVKDGSALVAMTSSMQLNIDKIIERFTRDPSKVADEDVAERTFFILEDRIFLTYHIADNRIAASTREFIKPPPSEDRRHTVTLHPDTHSTFQVDLNAKPKTKVELYNMLVDLLNAEETSKTAIRKSENEVRTILSDRTNEESNIQLEIDLFDTLRNTEAHTLRLELERAAEDERTRCKEVELDYLAPFLSQIEIVDGKLTREQAFALREECLQDFKQRQISKANIIQGRFERETQALQQKQQWYQLNQTDLTKEDEEQYLQYCNEANFRITTLEIMLAKHKQTAPQKYMALEKRLRHDPRLAEFLQTG